MAARKTTTRSDGAKAKKTAPGGAAAARKPAAKKPAAKKTTAKKTAAKKTAAKKPAAGTKAAPKKAATAKKGAAPEIQTASGGEASAAEPGSAGEVRAAEVNLGHVFALRPRVPTSFPRERFLEARRLLEDETFESREAAARAVVDKALALTNQPGKRDRRPRR